MSCPPEPARIRDMGKLEPVFYQRLSEYLKKITPVVKSFGYRGVGVHETLRTQERQDWLWLQGRVPGCGTRPVTWIRDSHHSRGIAADWHIIKNDGSVQWNSDVYARVYAAVDPAQFGLETLAPTEFVHLQIEGADTWNRKQRQEKEPAEWKIKVYNEHSGGDVLIRIDSKNGVVHVRRD